MVADVAQCLSRQELTDFASGRVAAERFDEIALHVDTCASCQSSVLELSERSDTFLERLRALPANDPLMVNWLSNFLNGLDGAGRLDELKVNWFENASWLKRMK